MLKNKLIRRILFMLASVCCVMGCIQLYIIKEKQAGQLLDLNKNIDVRQDEAQSDTYFEVSVSYEAELNKSINDLKETQDKVRLLQLKYDLSTLLEEKSNEDENSYAVYEKYLRLRQGEVARIDGAEDLSEWGMFGFLDGHFSGTTFPINEGMLLQYGNTTNIWEYLLPRCVIITDPDLKFGFMNARAGMDFDEIQENAYEAEIKKGFMYWSEQEVYYIQYTDQYYQYIFLSDYLDGRDSWLLVSYL